MDEPELCPRWWPWPFHGPHHFEVDGRIPDDARATINMFRALTVYNMAFQVEDAGASRDMKQVALKQIQAEMNKLQGAR